MMKKRGYASISCDTLELVLEIGPELEEIYHEQAGLNQIVGAGLENTGHVR